MVPIHFDTFINSDDSSGDARRAQRLAHSASQLGFAPIAMLMSRDR